MGETAAVEDGAIGRALDAEWLRRRLANAEWYVGWLMGVVAVQPKTDPALLDRIERCLDMIDGWRARLAVVTPPTPSSESTEPK